MIQGYVWNDTNDNGKRDGGEWMLAGATIVARDTLGQEVGRDVTGINGLYYIELLAPATYNVTEYDPPGYVSTTQDTWQDHVAAGATIERIFGDRPRTWFLPMIEK